MSAPAWLLGLELTRFAPADDQADALAGSLSAVEAGGWTLSPYDGPALQPLVGMQVGRVNLALGPGIAFRQESATTADGRDATVYTTQGRLGLRALFQAGPGIFGLDGAWSGGSSRLDGEVVATAGSTWEIGPTAGLEVKIRPHLWLLGRARAPFEFTSGDTSVDLSGAIGVEWRGGKE